MNNPSIDGQERGKIGDQSQQDGGIKQVSVTSEWTAELNREQSNETENVQQSNVIEISQDECRQQDSSIQQKGFGVENQQSELQEVAIESIQKTEPIDQTPNSICLQQQDKDSIKTRNSDDGMQILLVFSRPTFSGYQVLHIIQQLQCGLYKIGEYLSSEKFMQLKKILQDEQIDDYILNNDQTGSSTCSRTDPLGLKILVEPDYEFFCQCLNDVFYSSHLHKIIMFCGYTSLADFGWILQNTTFTIDNLMSIINTTGLANLAHKVYVICHNTNFPISLLETLDNDFQIKFLLIDLCQIPNTDECCNKYENIRLLLTSRSIENCLVKSTYIGEIKVRKPFVLIFPSNRQNSSLFCVENFSFLVNPDLRTQNNCWQLLKHIMHIDLMTFSSPIHNISETSLLLDKDLLNINSIICCYSDLQRKYLSQTDSAVSNRFCLDDTRFFHCLHSTFQPICIYKKIGQGCLNLFLLKNDTIYSLVQNYTTDFDCLLLHWKSDIPDNQSFSILYTGNSSCTNLSSNIKLLHKSNGSFFRALYEDQVTDRNVDIDNTQSNSRLYMTTPIQDTVCCEHSSVVDLDNQSPESTVALDDKFFQMTTLKHENKTVENMVDVNSPIEISESLAGGIYQAAEICSVMVPNIVDLPEHNKINRKSLCDETNNRVTLKECIEKHELNPMAIKPINKEINDGCFQLDAHENDSEQIKAEKYNQENLSDCNHLKTNPKLSNNQQNVNKEEISSKLVYSCIKEASTDDKSIKHRIPIKIDVVYIPVNENVEGIDVNFFVQIQATYYVFSSLKTSLKMMDFLLEAKQKYYRNQNETVVIPTHRCAELDKWINSRLGQLKSCKISFTQACDTNHFIVKNTHSILSAYKLEL